MVTRRHVVALGLGIAAGTATAGCRDEAGSGSTVSWSGNSPGAPAPSPTREAPSVTVTPAANARNVNPRDPVVVSVRGGTLRGVTVTTGSRRVGGRMDEQGWRTTGALGYGKTYTVKASVADASGAVTETSSTFSTMKPASVAAVTFQANALAALRAGGTYGVGQPVIVHFSRTVKDKAAAEKAMTVVTTPAVEGRWRWIDGRNAHWRPAKYWPPRTKITVRVNLLGTNLGNGVYGSTASTHFAIGRSRIAIADGRRHRMKVYIDGRLVRNIPISMGKGGVVQGDEGQDINYWTRSGPHVVLTKENSHRMTSASYGITDPEDPNFYDDLIKLCCRITYSGEFVHLADWNIPAHGVRNTSHGCINVGPAHARWFYETFQLGDVVEVTNTPRRMSLTDGLGDWTVPWNEW